MKIKTYIIIAMIVVMPTIISTMERRYQRSKATMWCTCMMKYKSGDIVCHDATEFNPCGRLTDFVYYVLRRKITKAPVTKGVDGSCVVVCADKSVIECDDTISEKDCILNSHNDIRHFKQIYKGGLSCRDIEIKKGCYE